MRDLLIKILMDLFDMQDTYCYNLTRDKRAFDVGTMTLDDFEEFSQDQIVEFADFILEELADKAEDINKQEEVLELINLLARRYKTL